MDERLALLPVPFAVIARIRNDAGAPQELAIALDGSRICIETLPANARRRADCAVARDWTRRADHQVSIAGAGSSWTLEYLELATHHGRSTGLLEAIVLPVDSRHYRGPSLVWLIGVWTALAALFSLEPRPLASRALRAIQLLMVSTAITLFTVVLLLPVFAPFRVVIAYQTFVGILLLTTLPRVLPAARVLIVKTAAMVLAAPTRIQTLVQVHQRSVVTILAVLTTVFAGAYGTRAVGGADEYGYVSQAELWLNGTLTIEQPFVRQIPWDRAGWSFAPHGYQPHPSDPAVLVPIYAPGLPAILAVAKLIGGQEAMFWVVPVSAGLLVLGTYYIGRRLGAGMAALVAALLVATSPAMLFMATSMMTDVPVATAWVWAFYCLLGTTIRSAAGAGLLSALAVFIRPNLAPLAGVLAMHYLLTARHRDARRQAIVQLLVFLLALVPGVVTVATINAHLYASPFSSGYGNLADLFAWSRVSTNLKLYLLWFAQAHTPVAWCGLVAVLLPIARLWPGVRDRGVLVVIAMFVVAVWAIYCAWLVFDVWWYMRFLLSSWPFIMLGMGSVAVLAYRHAGRFGRPCVVASVLAIAVFQLDFALDRDTFGSRDGRRRFVSAARLVRRATDRNSVIVSSDHSGSIRYYGGRMTINFGRTDDHSLDEIVSWLKQHGVRTYLAVEDWEIPEIRQRFSNNKCITALDGSPVAIHEVPGRMLLFDLVEPRPPGQTPIVERDVVIGPTAPPVAPPRLVLRDAS